MIRCSSLSQSRADLLDLVICDRSPQRSFDRSAPDRILEAVHGGRRPTQPRPPARPGPDVESAVGSPPHAHQLRRIGAPATADTGPDPRVRCVTRRFLLRSLRLPSPRRGRHQSWSRVPRSRRRLRRSRSDLQRRLRRRLPRRARRTRHRRPRSPRRPRPAATRARPTPSRPTRPRRTPTRALPPAGSRCGCRPAIP